MEKINNFYISNSDTDTTSQDSLEYSESDSEIRCGFNLLICKKKSNDQLEIIKNKISTFKPLNNNELYFIKNQITKTELNKLIDIFNESIKHIEKLIN